MNSQKVLRSLFQIGLCIHLTACSLPVATPTPPAARPVSENPQAVPTQTRQASPQDLPSATPLPGILPADEFTTENLDETPPDGILEEIANLGIGGGSDQYCNSAYPAPEIASDPEDTELMKTAEFVTCGWPAGETISYKVTFPNGRTVAGRTIATNSGGGAFSYAPGLDDPQGLYLFEISALQQRFSSNVFFAKPVAPRFYKPDPDHFLFINFQPNETLKLFVYDLGDDQYVFRGWQPLRVDDSGQLLLKVSDVDGFFFAQTATGLDVPLTTEDSNQFVFEINRNLAFAKRPIVNTSYFDTLTCSAGFESQLDFGGKNNLKVSLSKPGWLYANPRTNSRQVVKLAAGQAVEVTTLYPTVCNDGKAWRKVFLTIKTANGSRSYSGYLVEIDEAKNQLLASNLAQPATVTPVACPGSLKSRLTPEARARVAFTDGTNMRIRAEAGFTQKTIASVPEGTFLTVLGGPMCVDSVTWWQVRTKDGQEGWMAEYQNGIYLLEPYSW